MQILETESLVLQADLGQRGDHTLLDLGPGPSLGDSLQPVELRIDGRNVEMLFRGEESSLLERLAEISRSTPITHFEVRGADLEEIFVALMETRK